MSEAPNYVLFEHAVGYTLFKVKEFEDIGSMVPEVAASLTDPQRFQSIVQVHAFEPFKNTEAALENCNCISEGLLHDDLRTFLDEHLPKKKKKARLGVGDQKLAGSLVENVGCGAIFTGVVPEILRGIRMHFAVLAKDLPHHSLFKAQLGLGHSYSRAKVKFDVNRDDNMVIQSIALLDQLDKDINLFGMRIREWYSYHFPELIKIVPDQYNYIRCATAIMDRDKMDDEVVAAIQEIVQDEEKTNEIVEAARTSMGMEITELDLMNIGNFGHRVASLTEYRDRLHEYIKGRMNDCAPSLSALMGEKVGARLISRAGSLTSLAKFPASTIQILGAEKALFRALKTRSNTPKHGLLFHSTFIGRASLKNKGRISRFVANKCAIASRLDCFSDVPVATFGEYLKQQVEDRLAYFETGTVPKKNLEVMNEAVVAAEPAKAKVLKKRRKAAKKARKAAEAIGANGDANGDEPMEE
ncbi:SnoRNA binding domain protein [Aphelenchoides besseyi]|nr:SnoRNA binding domain protein [Aphelenchoides besseyi]KAI6229598.1 SnoRNA binding domain protein [Aphelenchoides besseyi]